MWLHSSQMHASHGIQGLGSEGEMRTSLILSRMKFVLQYMYYCSTFSGPSSFGHRICVTLYSTYFWAKSWGGVFQWGEDDSTSMCGTDTDTMSTGETRRVEAWLSKDECPTDSTIADLSTFEAVLHPRKTVESKIGAIQQRQQQIPTITSWLYYWRVESSDGHRGERLHARGRQSRSNKQREYHQPTLEFITSNMLKLIYINSNLRNDDSKLESFGVKIQPSGSNR